MLIALFALTAGAFGIGTTELVIMGLLLQVSEDLHVTVARAGLLVSAYAVGAIEHGRGLRSLGEVGAIVPLVALVLAFVSRTLERRNPSSTTAARAA